MFTIQRDPSSSRNDLFAPARLSESTLANLAPPKRDLFTTVDASNPSLIPSSTDTRFNPSDQTFLKPAGSIPQSSLQQQQQQQQPPTFQLGSTQLSTFKTPVVPDVKVPSFFVSSEEPSEHQKLDQLRHKRDSAANIFFEQRGATDKGAAAAASSSKDENVTPKKSGTQKQEQKPEEDENTKILVFGFAPNTRNTVVDHFKKYGLIAEYTQLSDSKLMIRYKSVESARKALASNGLLIGNYAIGVVSEAPATESAASSCRSNTIQFERSTDIFKDKKGLGSGKAGLSVAGLPNVSPPGDIRLIQEPGIISKVKDILFGGW